MHMSDYAVSDVKCPQCESSNIARDFSADLPTSTVVKADTEIKLGHLAHRNTERMSNDEKMALALKNNAYKYEGEDKDLPTGMRRSMPKEEKRMREAERIDRKSVV